MNSVQAKHLVNKWKRAAPTLRHMREESIRSADTTEAMIVLGECIDQAIKDSPPKPLSGMIEMQRYFRKLHPKTKQSRKNK